MAPTPKCKVSTCSHSKTNNKDLAFHKFPSNDPQTCALWIRACQQTENFNAKFAYLCEDHFVPSNYAGDGVNTNIKRKILKRGALPSRNLPGAKYTLVNQATKFHSPQLLSGPSQCCSNCKSNDTQFYCGKCLVNLCLQPCFKVISCFTGCVINIQCSKVLSNIEFLKKKLKKPI